MSKSYDLYKIWKIYEVLNLFDTEFVLSGKPVPYS